VYPLLSRLISQIGRFPAGRQPDLSRLEWLSERMKARHTLEVKHLGREAAVSRPLQTIINLVLCIQQAEAKLASKAAASSSSSSLTPSAVPTVVTDSDDPTNIGPDEQTLSWFDRTRITSELMSAIQSGAGVPAWFVRLAWLDMHVQAHAVARESEHPYCQDVTWTEISIPEAQDLTIRLHAKSKTDASDKLRFAVLAPGASVASSAGTVIKESDLTEVGSFGGPDMSKGVGSGVSKGGQSVEIKGGSRVFYSFIQAVSPVHPNVFCSSCDFPIKGIRFCCSHCDGSTEDSSNHRRRRHHHHDRSEGYSLCSACENSNQDSNKHDRSHVFAVVRRPLPRNMTIPRVSPSVANLYTPQQLQSIKAGTVPNVEHQKHVGSTCSVCNVSPIGQCTQQQLYFC
jgi:hypothetical protein